MKNLMKGILAKYQLDYEKTFSEQTTTVRLMKGVFNPSVTQLSNWLKSIHKHRRDRLRKRIAGTLGQVDRRLHANTRLAEVSV